MLTITINSAVKWDSAQVFHASLAAYKTKAKHLTNSYQSHWKLSKHWLHFRKTQNFALMYKVKTLKAIKVHTAIQKSSTWLTIISTPVIIAGILYQSMAGNSNLQWSPLKIYYFNRTGQIVIHLALLKPYLNINYR